jgi:hypothetical protein
LPRPSASFAKATFDLGRIGLPIGEEHQRSTDETADPFNLIAGVRFMAIIPQIYQRPNALAVLRSGVLLGLQ